MDHQEIKDLIELVATSGIARFELTIGEKRIVIKNASSRSAVSTQGIGVKAQDQGPASLARVAPMGKEAAAPLQEAQTGLVRAVSDGIVHLKPSPDASPFVCEEQLVSSGDTLCLIEVMKTFHAVTVDRPGKVLRIAVSDGQSVQFDDVLFEIDWLPTHASDDQ